MSSKPVNINRQAGTITGAKGRPMAFDLHWQESDEVQPLVIYSHGINGFKDWGGMVRVADAFAQAGYMFLRFNFSHNGTTPEDPTEFKDLEAYAQDSYLKRQEDLAAVMDFIFDRQAKPKIDWQNIHLIGHSRGGTDALLFAAADDRINKLVTWSAPAHTQTPWKNLDEEELEQWQSQGRLYKSNKRTGQDLPIDYSLYLEYQAHKNKALDIESKARALDQEWLIVHGEDDEAVFVKDAYSFKTWHPAAEVCIIAGTGHTFGRRQPYPEELPLPASTLVLVEKTIAFLSKERSLGSF